MLKACIIFEEVKNIFAFQVHLWRKKSLDLKEKIYIPGYLIPLKQKKVVIPISKGGVIFNI